MHCVLINYNVTSVNPIQHFNLVTDTRLILSHTFYQTAGHLMLTPLHLSHPCYRRIARALDITSSVCNCRRSAMSRNQLSQNTIGITSVKLIINILFMDPNTRKVQKNAVYWDKTQPANFRGNPIYQAAKRHLNNSWTVKNEEKWDGKLHFICLCTSGLLVADYV